jgi:hypothetical protein
MYVYDRTEEEDDPSPSPNVVVLKKKILDLRTIKSPGQKFHQSVDQILAVTGGRYNSIAEKKDHQEEEEEEEEKEEKEEEEEKEMSERRRRKRYWEEEAQRLNMRVKELELENAKLKSGMGARAFIENHINAEKESNDTANKETFPEIRIAKSRSFASGVGYLGYTVAEAVAASHRSRSKRSLKDNQNQRPLHQQELKPSSLTESYRAGYWKSNNNVKSSFSCNNLADMEHHANGISSAPALGPAYLISGGSTKGKGSKRAISVGILQPQPVTSPASMANRVPSNEDFRYRTNVIPTKLETLRRGTVGRTGKQQQQQKPQRQQVLSPRAAPAAISTASRSTYEARIDREGGHHILHEPDATKRTAIAGTKRLSSDIRIWTGTWNMGAADPFMDCGGIIDEQTSASMLQQFVPHGYDVYVLGVQEGVSENVYHAIDAYLNRNHNGARYYRMELKNSDFIVKNKNYQADAVFDAVRGRGDGAFVGTKFTGIAVFRAKSIVPKVQLLRAGVYKFNLTSGSKGGVAVALLMNQTTIVFVNCHLDARNDTYRREQIRNLNTNLGRVMGHPNFDLTQQYHHVVWMGDMNYRIVLLDPPTVIHMLEEGRNLELHDKFDGLVNDRRNGGVFDGFVEPKKWPEFYPTYKKFPKRGYVDEKQRSWPSLVYRVLYKEPFYKGGKVKKRVPGWCDRILTHSLLVGDSKLVPEKVPCPLIEGSCLVDNYRSVNHGNGMDISDHSPVFCTFIMSFPRSNAEKAFLERTDMEERPLYRRTLSNVSHEFGDDRFKRPSAGVGGSYFDQPNVVRRAMNNHSLLRPVSTVLRIFNMELICNEKKYIPKKTRVVAPLIGEDLKQCDVIGERCQGLNGLNMSLNAVMQHTRPLQQLHMLVWVKLDNIYGHCTLSLKRIAKQEEGEEVKFRVPLYQNSMRLIDNGHPVLVVFSVRSKTFVK